MPDTLYGKTQHKTLQARLSEDIVHYRQHSLFFRPKAGSFFLREFLDDASISSEHRMEAATPRRIRELVRGPALAVGLRSLLRVSEADKSINPARIIAILERQKRLYFNPKRPVENAVFIRSFVCVVRGYEVLTYRLGRYRDDRDSFMAKRSLGFVAWVNAHERSLFNDHDFGIVEAGINAVIIDLDIPFAEPFRIQDNKDAILRKFISCELPSGGHDLLAVITFKCPDWFEPTKRRLALNNITWIDIRSPVNDIDDFDPWSRAVLLDHYGQGDMLGYST